MRTTLSDLRQWFLGRIEHLIALISSEHAGHKAGQVSTTIDGQWQGMHGAAKELEFLADGTFKVAAFGSTRRLIMLRLVMLMTALTLFATPCFADQLSSLLQKQTMYRMQIDAAQEAFLELGLNHPVYTLTAIGTLASGLAAMLNENLPPLVRVLAGIASYYGASYCYQEWDQGCGAVSRELALIGTRMLTAQQALSEVERQITTFRSAE